MPTSVAKIIFNHFRHHAQIICGKLAQKVNFTENTLFTLQMAVAKGLKICYFKHIWVPQSLTQKLLWLGASHCLYPPVLQHFQQIKIHFSFLINHISSYSLKIKPCMKVNKMEIHSTECYQRSISSLLFLRTRIALCP